MRCNTNSPCSRELPEAKIAHHVERPWLYILLVFLWLTLAAPAFAVPGLLTGSAILTTPRRASTYSITVPLTPTTVSNAVTGSSPASFTFPPGALFGSSTPSFTFTNYSLFAVGAVTRSNPGGGSFFPLFVTPYKVSTVPANATMSPNGSTSDRMGYIRLMAGPNGFVGAMKLTTMGTYSGTWTASFPPSTFPYSISQMVAAPRGGSTTTVPGVVTGTRPYQASPTFYFESTGVVTQLPWFTGMVTALEPAGAYSTFVSTSGTDYRTPLGLSGAISLVSPRLLHVFLTTTPSFAGPDGIAVTTKSDAYASVARIDLSFTPLPEPTRLALLATGILGLHALAYLRRLRG